jgi:hypothetical protein
MIYIIKMNVFVMPAQRYFRRKKRNRLDHKGGYINICLIKLMISDLSRRVLANRLSKHMCFTVQSGHWARFAPTKRARGTETLIFISQVGHLFYQLGRPAVHIHAHFACKK